MECVDGDAGSLICNFTYMFAVPKCLSLPCYTVVITCEQFLKLATSIYQYICRISTFLSIMLYRYGNYFAGNSIAVAVSSFCWQPYLNVIFALSQRLCVISYSALSLFFQKLLVAIVFAKSF